MAITTDSPIYRQAFEKYLRKGTPLDVSLKAMQPIVDPTPFYVWRTQQDNKVRVTHGANEGRTCAWGMPPPQTGNPGDDFGCRCHAEPIPVEKIAVGTLLAIVAAGILLTVPASRKVAIVAARELVRRGIFKPNEVPAEQAPIKFDRPQRVPKDWIEKPSDTGGVKYVDPKDSGNAVRIESGKPNSSMAGQKVDAVRWQKNGKSLDVKGNIVPKQSLEAHIPVKDFKFNPELFK